jgi:hypothetical protein
MSTALSLDSEDSTTWWDRIVSEFPAAAEEWSRSINNLNRWEDVHLLSDKEPSPQALAKHRKIVERLMYFGQLCAFVASHPDFGDEETAAMVTASQAVLRHKLRMFHHPNPMSKEEADKILAEVFPES